MANAFTRRLKKLRTSLQKQEIDYLALVPGPNMFYLTGIQMHPSERMTLFLVPAQDKSLIIAPVLEIPRIRSRIRIPARIYGWRDEDGPDSGWRALKEDLQIDNTKIAVENLAMRVMEFTELLNHVRRVKTVDAGPLLANLRMIKDESELTSMRRAAHILDLSLEEVVSEMRIGMTEREIASMWQLAMKHHGADAIPDAPIVASGTNSANPHTTATDRKVERGEFVIFDGWCQVDGYYGDTTRTVMTGEPTKEQAKIYQIVLRANRAGVQAARAGVVSEQVDRAARGTIEQSGYGKQFLHRTGHGLGLEVHESPFMVEGNKTKLEIGMTFTVEPGVYVAGQGGVRIEDDVVITQDGAETLTKMDRELRVIG